MAAELWKLRSLPTPRWTLAATAAALLAGLIIVWIVGPEDGGDYETAADISGSLGTVVGSIVLGVWIIGVEYGQKTLRRVLTADPRRGRLLASKLAVGLAGVVALTVIVWAAAVPLFSAAASTHDASSPAGEIVDLGAAALVTNLIYATVGFAVALLTRSMAGGMTVALAFAFVIDTALGAVPEAGDYTLGASVTELAEAIRGEDGDHELGRAIPTLAAWLLALTGGGLTRFLRSDVS